MKRIVQIIALIIATGFVDGQGLSKKLEVATASLEADMQMKSALLSLFVVESKSGTPVFSRNSAIGLPVASSQKVVTSVAALEMLGLDYRYPTVLAYDGSIQSGILTGNIYLAGSGDPTPGSWRYQNTRETLILSTWINAIRQAGIRRINGNLIIKNEGWTSQTIPGGWIWDDIGNYYGAGAVALNWHENQYDLKLQSGSKPGDKVKILSIDPPLYNVNLVNELVAGKPGSGDNAYIYLPPYAITGHIRGTIPPAEKAFVVSGSFPDPSAHIQRVFKDEILKQGIEWDSSKETMNIESNSKPISLVTHLSPPLDSINYWFLRKSINLYGEALAKTVGYNKNHEGSTGAGVKVIKRFWKERGIDTTSINICDGSGLSPQNRVTTEALVKVMQFAKTRPWFSSFLAALPEYNGIKMKSGTIGGVKSFTGYINGYTFAIVVSNYNGSGTDMVRKMYRVLDILK